jgi:DNA-binding response OmpR family regulator
MSALIIVVNADLRALRHTEGLLSEHGYLVAALSSFVDARRLLDSVMPDLLIADLRLAHYNGLHLAIRSHQDHPDVPVIITAGHEDPVAEAEATRYGAAFVVAPLENREFLRHVQAAVAARRKTQRPIRRWLRTPVAGVVAVDAAHAQARIVDLSYGGVRLAFRDPCQIPTTFDIALPTGGVSVKAHCVWTAQSAGDNQVCCGAELRDVASGPWRAFVDAVMSHSAG